MPEKVCAKCNTPNPASSNYCSFCGAQDFLEPQSEHPNRVYENNGPVSVRIGLTRIVILLIATSGVYVLYWLYLTWKQLQDETKDIHYPIWHALAFLVPIYGLFLIYRHVATVQTLAFRVGVTMQISPSMAATMAGLDWLLAASSLRVDSIGIFMTLHLIRFALITTIAISTQTTLNRCWSNIKGESLQNLPMRNGEVGFVVLVILSQIAMNMFVVQ